LALVALCHIERLSQGKQSHAWLLNRRQLGCGLLRLSFNVLYFID
jgi:hypothetical protein